MANLSRSGSEPPLGDLPYRQWWPWWPLGFLVDLGGFLGGFLLIPIGGAGIGGGENLGV